GETYEETEDGPKLMDHITNSPDGLTITQELAKYLITPGGGHPRVSVQEYSTGSEASEGDLKVTEEILKPHLPDTVWSKFTYTLDETRELRSLEEIEKYVTEMRAKFITGDIDMSEWDDYLETVEKMGLDRYMEIQKDAYERYQES